MEKTAIEAGMIVYIAHRPDIRLTVARVRNEESKLVGIQGKYADCYYWTPENSDTPVEVKSASLPVEILRIAE